MAFVVSFVVSKRGRFFANLSPPPWSRRARRRDRGRFVCSDGFDSESESFTSKELFPSDSLIDSFDLDLVDLARGIVMSCGPWHVGQ